MTVTLMDSMEHKSLTGGGTLVVDDGEGIVEAVVAVTGILDEVGDIIIPGAFEKSLAKRTPKGVSHHGWDQPVSKALEVKELMPGDAGLPALTARGEPWPREAGALMVKMQFNLGTERGRDAYADVKFFGTEQEWSIGYNVPRAGSRIDHKKGIRYLDTIDCFEYSPVLFGAMPLAGTHSVKSYGGIVATSTLDVKALPGSYEERIQLLERAVSQTLTDEDTEWASVRAAFDDHVIACVYPKGPRDERQEYEMVYTISGGEVTLGEPKPVKIVEQIVQDATPNRPAKPVTEGDVQHKAETAYLSPSEIAATSDLRNYV